MRVLATLLAVTSIVSQVLATVYVTKPVATDECSATLECDINWKDDGVAPLLAQIGPSTIDLCTGGQFQQTCLQSIVAAPGVDVSKNTSVSFHTDPHIGPTGQYYFIKFTSLAYNDPATLRPFTAYSARFTLVGMMGTLNDTIMSEITSSVSVAASTASVAVSTSSISSAITTSAIRSTSTAVSASKASTSSAHASSSAAANGAVTMAVPGVMMSGVAVVVGALTLGASIFALGL